MNARNAMIPITALLLGALSSFPARAVHMEESASTACVGNSAQDDNAMRKRTGGATNESTMSIVITCSMPLIGLKVPPNDATRVDRVRVQMFNAGSATRSIGCRLVMVNGAFGGPDPILRNVTLLRGMRGVIDFQPDQDRHGQTSFAITCTIPPLISVEKVLLDSSEFQRQPME